jgi:phosphatidylserine/phosphatidylglycerophosphate/cardiolipin synthase-like enzyme
METEAIIGKQYPEKVIPLIDEAKKSLKIVVFDWRWYPNEPANPVQLFNQAIIRAKRRGVEVKAITNISEVISILKREGCEAKKPATVKLIHAKMMIIDDNIIIIGSHNYTQSAFTMNHEISTIITNETEMTDYIDFFNKLFNNYG